MGIHVEQDVGYVNPYSFGVYDLITTDEKNSILHDRLKGTKEWFDKIKTSAYHNKVQLTKTELVVSSVSDQKAIANYAKKEWNKCSGYGNARTFWSEEVNSRQCCIRSH